VGVVYFYDGLLARGRRGPPRSGGRPDDLQGRRRPRLESGAPAHHLLMAPSVLCREPSGRSSPTRRAFETFMSVLFVASAAFAAGALVLPLLFSLFGGRRSL
jgi:hypothetical protein